MVITSNRHYYTNNCLRGYIKLYYTLIVYSVTTNASNIRILSRSGNLYVQHTYCKQINE